MQGNTRIPEAVIRSLALACLALAGTAAAGTAAVRDTEGTVPAQAVQVYDNEYPFVNYSGHPSNNDIARLQQRLDKGELRLHYGEAHGYLESLLAALNISLSSQVLVFSKTSLQTEAISAASPRAIYFNDDTYIGWIATSHLLEVVTMDAERGAVFYSLANADSSAAHLQRETLKCLTCHDTYAEMGGGVPSFLFESTYSVRGHQILPEVVARETTDATPIAERWGGWYVTGEDGGTFHLGNIPPPPTAVTLEHGESYRGSLAELSGMFDTSRYPSDKSDIVALLVLQHQVSVHNLIVHANYKSRVALSQAHQDAAVHWADLPEPIKVRLAAMTEPLVRGMLMIGTAPLPRPVTGSSGYTAQFVARGLRDAQGRSLRDLDLKNRVFRYPMSFLVYSEGFDALPGCLKEFAYQRFREILTGQDHSKEYASLTDADRQAVLEILRATKPDFAQTLPVGGTG